MLLIKDITDNKSYKVRNHSAIWLHVDYFKVISAHVLWSVLNENSTAGISFINVLASCDRNIFKGHQMISVRVCDWLNDGS